MATKLVQIIALLYRMTDEDVTALENELLKARKREWQLALQELARDNGCTMNARPPSGSDLQELRAMSREDAQSIAATWNKDSLRAIEKIYKVNPRSNRTTYIKRMAEWESKRSVWKGQQIALTTAQQTRWYAQNRYRAENGLRGGRYIFTGPPAVCKKCLRLFAAGVVTEAYIQRHVTPVHPYCPHEWKVTSRQRIPCNELWIG